MPARERVSLEAIKAALETWAGNVQAAAEEVGLSRNCLYERLTRAGIDIATYRPQNGQQAAPAAPSGSPSPFTAKRRRPVRLRVSPRHVEQLSDARLDVLARYRVETDEQLLLDQFLDEQLAAWIRSKLGDSE